MNQRRLDELIVQAKRTHKEKMEKLVFAYLGKRADGIQDSQREISADDGLRDSGPEEAGPQNLGDAGSYLGA